MRLGTAWGPLGGHWGALASGKAGPREKDTLRCCKTPPEHESAANVAAAAAAGAKPRHLASVELVKTAAARLRRLGAIFSQLRTASSQSRPGVIRLSIRQFSVDSGWPRSTWLLVLAEACGRQPSSGAVAREFLGLRPFVSSVSPAISLGLLRLFFFLRVS